MKNFIRKVLLLTCALSLVTSLNLSTVFASEDNVIEDKVVHHLTEQLTRGDNIPTLSHDLSKSDYDFDVTNMKQYVYTNYKFTGAKNILIHIYQYTIHDGQPLFVSLYDASNNSLVGFIDITSDIMNPLKFEVGFFNLSSTKSYYIKFSLNVPYADKVSFTGTVLTY